MLYLVVEVKPYFDESKCEEYMKALKPPSRPNGFTKADSLTAQNGAVFWQSATLGPNDKKIQDNMKAAWAWVERPENSGKMTVEKTTGGTDLENLKLFEAQNPYTCPQRECTAGDLNWAGYYWNCASKWFAEQASGEIHAFGSHAKTTTPYGANGVPTFWNIELPNILKKNKNAHIIYHYNVEDFVWYKPDGTRRKYSTLSTSEKTNLPVKAQDIYDKYYKENIGYPSYGTNDDLLPGKFRKKHFPLIALHTYRISIPCISHTIISCSNHFRLQ